MTISRRDLLAKAGALSVSTALAGCGDDEGGADTEDTEGGDDGLPRYEYEGEPGPADLFQHGVASGDPLPDAVILWTRVTGATDPVVEVFYEVALDPEFSMRVAATNAMATVERDYTCKVDVTGLDPATSYYYRFFALGRQSVVGRTRTAPSGPVDRLRVAFCSCSSYAHGYFHAYRRMAERADIDVVLHLGDYIYEYGDNRYGDVRLYEPSTEIVTLEDYRMRYAQYRRDPDLQEVHRQHPMIAVWDDHEVTNDAWSGGAENHDDTEGDYFERKAIAEQVYREWLPIRDAAPGIVYRSFSYGDLLSIVMLDTRIVGRDLQVENVQDVDQIEDPARQLLGAEQEAWLEQQLGASTARWKLVGQQVMLGQMRLPDDGVPGPPFNLDQWDGYEAARTRFFDIIENTAPTNLVVLTGDIHSSWAMDLARDPYGGGYDPVTGTGAAAVEIITPAVTSPGLPFSAAAFQTVNPHLHWADGVERGYVLLDITSQRIQATWYHLADITIPEGGAESVAAVYGVYDGTNHLVPEDATADPPTDAPPLAPDA